MAALETPAVNIGWKARDFSLTGTDGKIYSLNEINKQNGFVIMFICNHCPFVKAIADKLTSDFTALQKLGVGSVAIMSNDVKEYPEDSFENMKKFKAQHGFPFPYVIDETQEVAKAYGAVCTPDFFGFDKNLGLQYRGRLDSSGMQKRDNNQRELFDAMKQVAEMGKVSLKQIPSIGCNIKWRKAA